MTTAQPPFRASDRRVNAESVAAKGAKFARIRLSGSAASSSATMIALYTITGLLVGVGLVMVLSASFVTSYLGDQGFFGAFWRQASYTVLGIPLMLLLSRFPLSFWKKWAWLLFGLGLALQMLVFTPLGFGMYGNRNWLRIGGLTGQPSETLKLALVVWIGAVIMAKQPLLGRVRHELIPVVFPGALIALGLVMLGSDLGTAMIMSAAVFGAMYFGGVSWRTLGTVALGGAVSVFLFVVTSPNRMQRLFSFASGDPDYSGTGWQPMHGLWALAGGGLFGVGLGGSKAKWSWLPAADNDYIFAIIGEELGFIGAVFVMLLYLALAVVLLRAIGCARDRFGRAVIGGIMVWIVGQAFVNIGVVVRVLPVLGVPLPLISSGGTALVACLLAIGVVASIVRDGDAHRATLAEGRAASPAHTPRLGRRQ